MSDIGDILNIANLVSQEAKVAHYHIEVHVGFSVPHMSIGINGGAANIDADEPLFYGHKGLFITCQAIVES